MDAPLTADMTPGRVVEIALARLRETDPAAYADLMDRADAAGGAPFVMTRMAGGQVALVLAGVELARVDLDPDVPA